MYDTHALMEKAPMRSRLRLDSTSQIIDAQTNFRRVENTFLSSYKCNKDHVPRLAPLPPPLKKYTHKKNKIKVKKNGRPMYFWKLTFLSQTLFLTTLLNIKR